MKQKQIITSSFFSVFFLYLNLTFSQTRKVIFIDNSNKENINEVKILSDEGSIIGATNDKGEFNFNVEDLKSKNILNIETSHFLYETKKIEVSLLKDKIELLPKINILEEVVIKQNKSQKYYKKIAYFRTWRLLNNKLQNYVEGIKDVYLPFDDSNSIKEYYTQYIAYKDSLFNKNFIDISFGGDGFLFTKIYTQDYYTRFKKTYFIKNKINNQYDLIENNSTVGYIKFDENEKVFEINKNDIAENIKFFGRSLSYKDYVYEKWNNSDNRHLSMSRNTIIKDIKSKKGIISTETVTEIYVEDTENVEDHKPKKYRNIVNPDKSFYQNEFYLNFRKKYPLQKEIELQLKNIKLNENSY